MTKHISEEKGAEYFMNSLVNNEVIGSSVGPAIEVQRVENGMVLFNTLIGTVKFLQSILKVPLRLAEFVYHAITGNEVDVVGDETDLGISIVPLELSVVDVTEAHPLEYILNCTDQEILTTIFTPAALDEFGLTEYAEMGYGTVSNHSEQRSVPSAKRKAAGYELIQLVFSKPEQVINIMMGLQNPINSEDDIEASTITTEGTNILAVKVEGHAVDTVFNVAAFKQMLQRYVPELSAHTAPIIAQIEENLYSVDLEQLKQHVGQHVSELLFHQENNGSNLVYRPVGIPLPGGRLALQSDSNLSAYGEKALFYIAIDVSGSMEQNFPSCIEKLQLVLKDIIDSTDNWEINLTDFDSTSRSRVFNSNMHSLQSLEEHVANLYVRDCTRLYDTMLEQFDAIVQNHSGYSSVAMIVFTDGLDNASTIKKSSVVTQSALSSREAVENFQIFTIELGNRNSEFFTELANEAGCTHISIDNIEQFQELRQYAGSLSESSHVLKFLDKAMHTYHQVMVEGKISVGRSTVSVSDVMTIGGEGYSISQPTFPLLTELSAPDAVENSESLELNLLGANVNADI